MKHCLLNFLSLKVWTIFIFPIGTFKRYLHYVYSAMHLVTIEEKAAFYLLTYEFKVKRKI